MSPHATTRISPATATSSATATIGEGATATGSRRYRVLIVDDHPIVRHGLAELINKTDRFEVCAQVASASAALEMIQQHQPHAAIIDISLEGGSGLELIKQVRAQEWPTRMLVSSMHDELLYAERALRAGAMGYVNKSEATEQVIDALDHVLEDRVFLSGPMTERVLQRMMQSGGNIGSSPVEGLSDRELEVFEMIGQGLSTREIAKRLHLSPKTIETHREHLKTKLNLENNNQLVRMAVQWVLDRQ
ncbi:MAG: response regulator transcription factor [Phycisphaeraceae bacterium]